MDLQSVGGRQELFQAMAIRSKKSIESEDLVRSKVSRQRTRGTSAHDRAGSEVIVETCRLGDDVIDAIRTLPGSRMRSEMKNPLKKWCFLAPRES